MRIIDPDKTLLDFTQTIAEDRISKESDEGGNTSAYLTITFLDY